MSVLARTTGRRRSRVGIGIAAVTALLLLPTRAVAAEPPIENLVPENGANIVSDPESLASVPVEFTCAPYSEFTAVFQQQYVKFATSPELGPDGTLAQAFTTYIDYRVAPVDAQQTRCRAVLPEAPPGQTFYWQVVRVAAKSIPGPVWGFNMVFPVRVRAGKVTAYIACGLSSRASRASTCPRRSKVGAFFRSPYDVLYKVCVRFPSRRTICASEQEATHGTLYVNKITSNASGKYKVTWFTSGRRISRYFWRRSR